MVAVLLVVPSLPIPSVGGPCSTQLQPQPCQHKNINNAVTPSVDLASISETCLRRFPRHAVWL